MKSAGVLLTSDKFWSDGSIKPGFGLIWRREETSSEWSPELDNTEKRRRRSEGLDKVKRRRNVASF